MTNGGGASGSALSPRGEGEERRGLLIVLAAVLAYCCIHAGFRLLASSSLGEDDPLENVLVQTLRLGYQAPQPPLYDWVLHAVQRVTGPGVTGFLLIKYAALTATAVLLYLSAVRVLRDWLWAALTVECMALIYQIAWRYHEGFTHEVGAMVAVAATLWAWITVISPRPSADPSHKGEGSIAAFLHLSLIAGLGAMTEPTYWAFLASLTAASLLQPVVRARLLRPGLALAALVALLVASPYIFWIATYPGGVSWVHPWSPSALKNLGKGLLDAIRGPLFYLSPLIVIVPLVFPGALRVALADFRRAPNRSAEPDLAQMILHAALAGMLLSLVGAVTLGLAGYAMHRLMPLYLPAVIWLMSVAQRASAGNDVPRLRFARLAAGIAVLALVARLANMFVLDPVCKLCRWGIPYPGLAQEITRLGFTGGTIVSPDHELAGNMRAQLPHAQVIIAGSRAPALGGDLHESQVAYIWPSLDGGGASNRYATAPTPEGIDGSTFHKVQVPWRHLWRPTGYRHSTWRVLIVKAKEKSP